MRGKKLFNGIATESRENMRQYFFAVLQDNYKEQRLKGFADQKEFPAHAYGKNSEPFTFEKTFTFKEHGEFFRGALTLAGLRYTGDFFDLLQRYGTIKVTITKFEEKKP